MAVATQNRLAEVRSRHGISLAALATEIGVDKALLSRLENGKASVSPKVAKNIARFFKDEITRDEILFPEEYPANGRMPVRSAR